MPGSGGLRTVKRPAIIAISAANGLVLLAGGAAAGAAVAGPVDSSGVIHGCYVTNGSGGQHAIVLENAGSSCPAGMTAITWNQQGAAGPAGPAGAAGPAGPAGPAGAKGDTGPAGAKGDTGATGPQGPKGDTGDQGPAGPAGADGHTVLNGTGAPDNATGSNGDFYIDTSANMLYGPKAGGSWPSGTSLTGPAGPPGPAGPAGSGGGSLDSLIGSPCDQGTEFAGTLSVGYTPQPNGTDQVTLTCQQTSPHYGLTVTIDQGHGLTPAHGRVTSQPAGIDCTDSSPPSACLGIFPQGTVVTLTETPLAGHFDSWSGCDALVHDPAGDLCRVHIDQARFVTAHFTTAP